MFFIAATFYPDNANMYPISGTLVQTQEGLYEFKSNNPSALTAQTAMMKGTMQLVNNPTAGELYGALSGTGPGTGLFRTDNAQAGMICCITCSILGVHPMPCKVVHFYVRKSPSQSDQ